MNNAEIYIQLLKQELENRGQIQLTVHGDSMLPGLKEGDIVKVEKCNEYKIGDIIAYPYLNRERITIFIHRIIFIRSHYVLAKGDNNSFIDPIKIKIDDVIGKVN